MRRPTTGDPDEEKKITRLYIVSLRIDLFLGKFMVSILFLKIKT